MKKRKMKELALKLECEGLAIACVGVGSPCEVIRLSNGYRLNNIDYPELYEHLLTKSFKWTISMVVFGQKQDGTRYSKSSDLIVKEPCHNLQLSEILTREHEKIIAGFNPKHLVNAGWLAIPKLTEISEADVFNKLKQFKPYPKAKVA